MTEPAPDTADLRSGAPIHDNLLALLPLVGMWRGSGTGVVASTGGEFSYGQQVSFVHDGRPFLAYESRAWLLDADGGVIRQAWRESGFWRPGAGPDDVEVVLASNTGRRCCSPALPETSVGTWPRQPQSRLRPRSLSTASGGSTPCSTATWSTRPSSPRPASPTPRT